MAWLTKGYSFAFQLLGYLYWEACSEKSTNDIDLSSIISLYDQYLAEFSYDKIWSELPTTEKKILISITQNLTNGYSDVKNIRETIDMTSSKFAVYRDRLLDRGLINGDEYGKNQTDATKI